LVCGFGPDDFKDLDAVKRSAESGRQMLEKVTRNGFTLFQHNHYWEFDRIDGKLKYDIYRELCPGMKYQIDCFWSTNKGTEDPVEMLKKFSDDTILIHMKDGKTVQPGSVEGMKNGLLDCKIDLLPLGEGELPIKRLIAEMPEQVETVIVELDYCNSTDMFSAIERSCRYMLENHLALGRN
ncbi:MAG: hypothetical protein PHI35_07565, partial [Victivallaceae bacterium]|nr:hypothetical protein [Victivallaceae bacterium]